MIKNFLPIILILSGAYGATNEHILYIARHGETHANKEEVLVGQALDSRAVLTEKGRVQAIGLANLLTTSGIEKIYVSRLLRSQQTAEPLTKILGLTPIVRSYLDEQNFGALEGKSLTSPEVRAALNRNDRELYYRPGNGEDADEVQKRVSHFLDEVFQPEAPKTILAIGHYGTVRAIIVVLMKLTPEQNAKIAPKNDHRFRIDWANGVVTRFQRSVEGKQFVDVKVEDLYSPPVAQMPLPPHVVPVERRGVTEAKR